MYLFISEITGVKTGSALAQQVGKRLLPELEKQGISASCFVQQGGARCIVEGWVPESRPMMVDELVVAWGWSATTRVFSSAGGYFRLPPSKQMLAACDMPNNSHYFDSRGAKACPAGHTFSDDHNIDHCVICALPLS